MVTSKKEKQQDSRFCLKRHRPGKLEMMKTTTKAFIKKTKKQFGWMDICTVNADKFKSAVVMQVSQVKLLIK